MSPKAPTPPRWVAWPLPSSADPPGYTWAHRVTAEGPGRLEVACGLAVSPTGAQFGPDELVEHFGTCPACSSGRPWDDAMFAEAFPEGGTT